MPTYRVFAPNKMSVSPEYKGVSKTFSHGSVVELNEEEAKAFPSIYMPMPVAKQTPAKKEEPVVEAVEEVPELLTEPVEESVTEGAELLTEPAPVKKFKKSSKRK